MHYDLLPIKHVKGFLERVKLKKKKRNIKKGVKEREGKRNFSARLLLLLCPLSNSNNATL